MKRHPFDLLSFLFGAIFIAVAILALLGIDLLNMRDAAWVIPAILVVLGAALLAGAAGRRSGPDLDQPIAENQHVADHRSEPDHTADASREPAFVASGHAAEQASDDGGGDERPDAADRPTEPATNTKTSTTDPSDPSRGSDATVERSDETPDGA